MIFTSHGKVGTGSGSPTDHASANATKEAVNVCRDDSGSIGKRCGGNR
jgi:hypothetical protein